MKLSKRQQEIEARKAADPIAQAIGRDDIDYESDELPTAPRDMAFVGEVRTGCQFHPDAMNQERKTKASAEMK